MSEEVRLPRWLEVANPVIVALQRVGLVIGTMRLLSVPGRKSGKLRTTPVSPLTVDGRRYIVAGYEGFDWVKNVRAAGWGILARGRKEERVTLVELPVEERGPILREFPREVPHGVQFFEHLYGVSGDPEEFAALAPRCPVFRVERGNRLMETKTGLKAHSTARERYATGSVISKDGTTIGYRQLGRGPGVVLVHGSMSSAHNHMELAEALDDAFTVYVPDRRGRGLSGPYGEDDSSIEKEVDDLDALLTQTGAHNIFGISSGGIICLQAALTLPAIHRAAIYEPPLFIDSPAPTAILARFDGEMAEGKVAAALGTAMKGSQMGPPIFNVMPRKLLELLTNMAMRSEDKKAKGDYVPMRMLAPTLHYDFQLIVETSGALESFRAIPAEVLLLGGSKSPAYLETALDALEKVLPHARRVEFSGLDHAASWNTDRGGRPEPVAQELRRFFARA